MQKITPFLWFNNKAEEAMNLYTSIFNNSKITSVSRYGDAGPGPKGTVMMGTFQLEGQEFHALNGGPHFSFTPAISFFVNCATQQELDGLWAKLSEGGTILMELAKYPFSERFGWLDDRFGVSWQLNLRAATPKISPFLLFVGPQHGNAEEAINFYTSLFKNSGIAAIHRFGKGEPGAEGTVKFAAFSLEGQQFKAMDSNANHAFSFSGATSFFVNCQTQEEVDYLWESLSAGGSKSQCGWLTDKYGVYWQIIPTILGELMRDKDPAKAKRVMKAMLQMTKIDIQLLKQAYKQG